ncbi:GAP1-N2 domain-containing protein [Neobacillus jeddahensis]|uniref:GAP1-N2 domain-containing protein n=1 Tax=Neobacillus jeddahensis TaxID=1461580 RepID=UPI000695080D|nr:hypothetical protein [Neobacillus jeddahensis]
MSGSYIQQQLYTRERGGIFHNTDGYDTIAISPGLNHAYVKKYLHPFCLYQAPKSLAARGKKDVALYPKALTMFQPENGDLVIGQAVFIPADFTGQRSAYFMHTYVIPSSRKEEWIKNPEKLFHINDFKTSYQTEQGTVLPVQDDIEYDTTDVLAGKDEFLLRIGISDTQFKQLLFAVLTSIGGKKKVFIALNVPLEEYSKSALQLLELVYVYLPYAYRRKLGAITFTSEPEGKNYIHVMFYEPGTLNRNDRAIEKQFIFDFANGRISGVEIAGQKHEYLDFALDHFSRSKRIDDFFEFADMALSGLPEQQKIEAANYYQLTDLYIAFTGTELRLYHQNKLSFLQGLLLFLQVNGIEKTPLIELFEKILNEEKYVQDPEHALDYITTVIAINKVVSNQLAFSFILQTLDYYRSHPIFSNIWKILEQDRDTYELIVQFLYTHSEYEGLLRFYLEERLQPFQRTEEILNEIQLLLRTPSLLDVDLFHSIVKDKVDSTFRNQSYSFPSILAVRQFHMEIEHPKFTSLKKEILHAAQVALLDSLEPKKLSIQEILTLGKTFPSELILKDERAKRNSAVVNLLYQLLSYPSQARSVSFYSLGKSERALVREILQSLLETNLKVEYFPLLLIAYGSESAEVDYHALFKHLAQYNDGNTIVVFIQLNARLVGVNQVFRQALRTYLITNPESIWKDRTFRKELELIRDNNFINFLKEMATETASPLIKFLKKKRIRQ